MKSPKVYKRMFDLSFLITLVLYIPPAVLGYWSFGAATESPILLNLEKGVPTYMAIIGKYVLLF